CLPAPSHTPRFSEHVDETLPDQVALLSAKLAQRSFVRKGIRRQVSKRGIAIHSRFDLLGLEQSGGVAVSQEREQHLGAELPVFPPTPPRGGESPTPLPPPSQLPLPHPCRSQPVS